MLTWRLVYLKQTGSRMGVDAELDQRVHKRRATIQEGIQMCILRANVMKNCGKCKSSVRFHCSLRRKTVKKTYFDSKDRRPAMP